ncbi:MAG: hypothetical protein Q7U47_07165 [Paludibacter sp.]|nr:hypothetical protein [Paludibacter sp.]
MKTKISILAMSLIAATTVFAQTKVALHSNGTVTIFSTANPLIAAYDAAITNDTIYVPGGVFSTPPNFNKKITIFGAGHFPAATMATMPTNFNGSVVLKENADGFHLQGVNIIGNLIFADNEKLDDVEIKRCRIQGETHFSGPGTNRGENNYFTENIFVGGFNNASNLINSFFVSNIFQSRINAACTQLNFFNNVFLISVNDGSGFFAAGAFSSIFKNNVFADAGYTHSHVYIGVGTNTFTHNIFTHTTPYLGVNPVLINNNYVARADIFVNQTGNVFDYTHDYRLQPATAALLGSDGLQRGLYGGPFPFKDFSIPVNPHIISKTIAPQTNNNGELNIQIQVGAQNN